MAGVEMKTASAATPKTEASVPVAEVVVETEALAIVTDEPKVEEEAAPTKAEVVEPEEQVEDEKVQEVAAPEVVAPIMETTEEVKPEAEPVAAPEATPEEVKAPTGEKATETETPTAVKEPKALEEGATLAPVDEAKAEMVTAVASE